MLFYQICLTSYVCKISFSNLEILKKWSSWYQDRFYHTLNAYNTSLVLTTDNNDTHFTRKEYLLLLLLFYFLAFRSPVEYLNFFFYSLRNMPLHAVLRIKAQDAYIIGFSFCRSVDLSVCLSRFW